MEVDLPLISYEFFTNFFHYKANFGPSSNYR